MPQDRNARNFAPAGGVACPGTQDVFNANKYFVPELNPNFARQPNEGSGIQPKVGGPAEQGGNTGYVPAKRDLTP